MILNSYKENWEEIVKQLTELRDEMAEGRKVETEGISIVEAPFYDFVENGNYQPKWRRNSQG